MLSFHSARPDILGASCANVLVQEYWHAGELVSSANVVFLALSTGVWHRIAIDAGVVFWRVFTAPDFPTIADFSPQYGEHRLLDLAASICPHLPMPIESVRTYTEPHADVDVLEIRFANGVALGLRHLRTADTTQLAIHAPAS